VDAVTIAPAVPATRHIPQHMQALARANSVRLARAEIKRRVGGGDISAAEVISECASEVESMTLAELLNAQRRWGRTRVRRFLYLLQLSENKRIGTLTSRQRAMLCTELAAKAAAKEMALV
jgi:hypothetical protein